MTRSREVGTFMCRCSQLCLCRLGFLLYRLCAVCNCVASTSGNKFSGTKEVYVERFDSVAEVNGSLIETPVGAVQHDTEVLHDVDSTESLETLLLDGYDTQVVPDSDDEVTDAAERKGFSCQSDSFVDSAPPSFSPCKKQRHPIAYIAACASSRHVSE